MDDKRRERHPSFELAAGAGEAVPLALSRTDQNVDTPIVLAVRIRLQDPALLDELVAAFRAAECACRREGEDTCVVAHSTAADEREQHLELVFFLRAWALQHGGVESVVMPAESRVQA